MFSLLILSRYFPTNKNQSHLSPDSHNIFQLEYELPFSSFKPLVFWKMAWKHFDENIFCFIGTDGEGFNEFDLTGLSWHFNMVN